MRPTKARFTGGRLQGLGARAFARLASGCRGRRSDRRAANSQRRVGLSTCEVEVEVERGLVTLRGSVGSRSLADDLVTRVEKVPGVRDVAAMIRVTAATS